MASVGSKAKGSTWRAWGISKSPWVYHIATGTCNNCDIELLDCLTPRFDLERFGIKLVGSPRHADVLMVTGMMNRKCLPRFLEVCSQVPKPYVIVALGACGANKGIFHDSYNTVGPVERVVREVMKEDTIVVNVPGCPPKPEAIILGVVKGLKLLREGRR